MSGWITPALAGVVWAGLLAQTRIGRFVDARVWLLGGVLLLGRTFRKDRASAGVQSAKDSDQSSRPGGDSEPGQ